MRLLALIVAGLLLAHAAAAAELLMVTTAGCPWCARWERELGAIYPRTAEGHILPLRQVEFRGFHEPLILQEPLRYTPTFIVVEHGREVGRITGYQGQDAFWGLLGQLAGRLAGAPPFPLGQRSDE